MHIFIITYVSQQIDAKSSWLSLRHCNTSGMTLAGRGAFSRLQIELVIVESNISPSLRKSQSIVDSYSRVQRYWKARTQRHRLEIASI